MIDGDPLYFVEFRPIKPIKWHIWETKRRLPFYRKSDVFNPEAQMTLMGLRLRAYQETRMSQRAKNRAARKR